jgi:hypothetical protein
LCVDGTGFLLNLFFARDVKQFMHFCRRKKKKKKERKKQMMKRCFRNPDPFSVQPAWPVTLFLCPGHPGK